MTKKCFIFLFSFFFGLSILAMEEFEKDQHDILKIFTTSVSKKNLPERGACIGQLKSYIKNYDRDQCKKLFSVVNSNNTSLLILSLLTNNFFLAEFLLYNDLTDVNCRDPKNNNSPVHTAVAKYKFDLCKLIIIRGVQDVNLVNNSNDSCLHYAFKFGCISSQRQKVLKAKNICAFLIQNKADPNQEYNLKGVKTDVNLIDSQYKNWYNKECSTTIKNKSLTIKELKEMVGIYALSKESCQFAREDTKKLVMTMLLVQKHKSGARIPKVILFEILGYLTFKSKYNKSNFEWID